MAVRPVVVCDICQSDGHAEHYRIIYPDGVTWEVDLCNRPHDLRLQQFRSKGIGHEVTRGTRRRTFAVTQLEDVGKPAKKTAAPKQARKRS